VSHEKLRLLCVESSSALPFVPLTAYTLTLKTDAAGYIYVNRTLYHLGRPDMDLDPDVWVYGPARFIEHPCNTDSGV
jgi:hypothetical protein